MFRKAQDFFITAKKSYTNRVKKQLNNIYYIPEETQRFPSNIYSTLVKCLRQQGVDIVQHYCYTKQN